MGTGHSHHEHDQPSDPPGDGLLPRRGPGPAGDRVSAERTLMHAIAQLAAALVHADPLPGDREDPHALLAHHRQAGRG
jgi:hypothetical protein